MREIIREIVYYGNWVLLLAIMIMIVMYLYRIIRALISGNTDRIKINLLLGAIGLVILFTILSCDDGLFSRQLETIKSLF